MGADLVELCLGVFQMSGTRVLWKRMAEDLPLNATLSLQAFHALCWHRLLTDHGIYVTSHRPGSWSHLRGYTAHFRCISHEGCVRERLKSDACSCAVC